MVFQIWIITVLLFLVAFSSCAPTPEVNQGQSDASKSDTRLAGRVEKVDLEAKFVFFRRYGAWRFDPDTEVLLSRGEGGRTANLLPTGEKLGEHIAADIRAGEVAVGDMVLVRRIKEKDGNSDKLPPPQEPDAPRNNF